MSLNTPWQIEQTWGSSQAVLRGVAEAIKPHSAVECGCGNFSTPLLRLGASRLLTVEHDRPWSKRIQRDYPPCNTHYYVDLPLPGIRNGTPHADVPPGTLEYLANAYEHLAADVKACGFVLIDTFRCARVIAAKALARCTPLMMLHDVRPESREYYRYHDLDGMLGEWHRYEHRPVGKINKAHIIPWTALYSREPLDLEPLQGPIRRESERLWRQSIGLEEIHG